jgi:molybdate-binding protein/DNA-binding XRE family transcriptional regulator
MAETRVHNSVRHHRTDAGWSQQQLADRAGLSRAEVSAVETGRLVPSAAVALALARAFGCAVEDLFMLGDDAASENRDETAAGRYWLSELGGRVRRIAAEPTHVGVLPHDVAGRAAPGVSPDPRRTLVLAGCDPAVGLLSAFAAGASNVRVIPLIRSSRRSLDLLRDGCVHVAGVHLGDDAAGNATVARDALGPGYRRVHVARWTEGVALAPGLGHRTVSAAVKAPLRWVGREDGSGARRCLDLILEGRTSRPDGYDRTASDHRGVVETIRTGWAQAGVCVELAAREGGLDFLPVKQEDYDFFYPERLEDDVRVRSVLDVLRLTWFREALSALPGYVTARTGELS